MTKEELLKEIMKLPKIETDNPICTMNGINVDELMSAIDRLNKIPDYNDLLKKNKQLKECYCNRTDCSGRIKNSRKYDSLYQKHNKQLDNWIKLREYINKMHEYFLYTDVNEIYKQSMKEDNSFPNLFNLSELNASDRILSSICKKIQELEQGSDNNECNTIQ